MLRTGAPGSLPWLSPLALSPALSPALSLTLSLVLSLTHLITAADPEGVIKEGRLEDPPRSLGCWYPQPTDAELLELHVHRPAITARLELGAYLGVQE